MLRFTIRDVLWLTVVVALTASLVISEMAARRLRLRLFEWEQAASRLMAQNRDHIRQNRMLTTELEKFSGQTITSYKFTRDQNDPTVQRYEVYYRELYPLNS